MGDAAELVIPLDWVTKDRYMMLTGLSYGKIRNYIQSGKWISADQYKIIGRETWISIKGVEEWIIQEGSDQTATVSKSVSSIEDKPTRSRYPKSRTKLT